MEENKVEQPVVEEMFTTQQLVQFGYYLLSDQRTKLIKDHTKGNHKIKMERLKQVYHADIENFKHLSKLAESTD